MNHQVEVLSAELQAVTEELELTREQMVTLEGELEACRSRYNALFEFTPVAILTLDKRGCVTDANPRALRLLQRSGRKLLGRPLFSFFTPPDARRMSSLVEEALGGQEGECEVRLLREDVAVRLSCSLGPPLAEPTVQCALADVTEAQRVEAVVRESDARWRNILDCMPSSVLTTDGQGTIQTANRAALMLFESVHERLIGSSVLRHLECEPLQAYLVEHKTDLGPECTAVAHTAHGRALPVEVTIDVYPYRSTSNLVIVVRDVVDRQRLQREVLQMREAEHRRIGRDLHDGLGQQMAGLGMLVRTLASKARGGNHELALLADRASEIVNQVVAQTRALARAMYPVELESTGLVPALRALATQVSEQSGVRVQVRVHETAPLEIDLECASHLYRIVQEALNNAVRHSGAQSVFVRLLNDRSQLELSVVDDGCGPPTEAHRKGGMGLRLMTERATLIGGHLSVGHSTSGGRDGTSVRCVLPRRPTRTE